MAVENPLVPPPQQASPGAEFPGALAGISSSQILELCLRDLILQNCMSKVAPEGILAEELSSPYIKRGL